MRHNVLPVTRGRSEPYRKAGCDSPVVVYVAANLVTFPAAGGLNLQNEPVS